MIRYKPRANRHMLSAYAKYTMRIGNNRQTPADMHTRRCALTFAYVCECGNERIKKRKYEHRKNMEIKVYADCESVNSTNLNKSRACKVKATT